MEKQPLPPTPQPAPLPKSEPGQLDHYNVSQTLKTPRTPPPGSHTHPVDQKKRSKFSLAAAGMILAVAIGAGVYFNSEPAVVPDQPTQAQIAEMHASWDAASAARISLPAVKKEEQKEALAQMPIAEKDKQVLQAELDTGKTSLVWLTVWDNMAEDGDIISLRSDGLTLTVPILLKPQRIAMPRPASGVINLTGVKDGGGGITLGLMSGNDQVLMRPLSVGERVGIPVR
ncbi:hypothetical protein AGMMS50256_14730 [Betaproteobacteria bacterium]|nr:hypothetical protein AGMMS50256_14730 [Betaproteobacteria bacterium]